MTAPRCCSNRCSDHWPTGSGPRPVLLGGLLGFAATSAAFVLAGNPAGLWVARFAQGAAAAAFPPAGAMIARLAPDRRRGRAVGSYGAGDRRLSARATPPRRAHGRN